LATSQERFTEHYDQFFDRVYRYVYRRVGQSYAADVTSEVFVKAWRGFDGYHGPSFAAWIFRIAHCEVTDLMRRRGKAPQEDIALLSGDAIAVPDSSQRVETDLVLAGLLARLPEAQRAVVELRFFGDLKHKDIARVLGKSEGAVKVSLQRALSKLHDELCQREEASI
jgi:RNA polymerase sigma-70 factor, ECF subfamily